MFHPKVQTQEADVQVFHWTKSMQVDHRPAAVEQLRDGIDLFPFRKSAEKSIIVARNFETQSEYTPQTYPFGLVQNLLKNVFTHAPMYPRLLNLHVAHEPYIAATWTHLNETLAVRGRPGLFLTSKEGFPHFYDNDIIEESRMYSFESMGDISLHIDLKRNAVREENNSGFLKGRTFPHFHTLIVVDNQGTPEVQLIQKGIMYTFGALVAQASERHGNGILGKQLLEPECAQCIVTNGKRFSFIWYQLNTLDTGNTNDGVKNLVCIERPGLLYSKIEAVKGRRKKRVSDLNDEILRTLLSVLLM